MKCAACIGTDVIGYLKQTSDSNVYFVLCEDCLVKYEGFPVVMWGEEEDEGA